MCSDEFGLAREIVRLVQVIGALQSRDGNGADVADVEIGVKTILEREILVVRLVGDGQFCGQSLADRDPVIGREFREKRRRRRSRQREADRDFARGKLGDFAQFPGLNAGKAVRRFPFARAEPRENDRDAAADGRAVRRNNSTGS